MPAMMGRYGKRLIVWGSYDNTIQVTMRGPSNRMDWDDRFDAAEALRFFTDCAAEIAKILHPPPPEPALAPKATVTIVPDAALNALRSEP